MFSQCTASSKEGDFQCKLRSLRKEIEEADMSPNPDLDRLHKAREELKVMTRTMEMLACDIIFDGISNSHGDHSWLAYLCRNKDKVSL